MRKLVKKFIIIFINLFLFFTSFTTPAFSAEESEEGLIWDYRSDKFLESLKDGHGIYDEATQRDLDNQIREGLNITLLPIDLEFCLRTALENNYDIKISATQREENKWLYRRSIADLLPDIYYRYQIQALKGEFLVGDVLPRVIRQNPIFYFT